VSTTFLVTYVALWVVTLATCGAVLLLYRVVGSELGALRERDDSPQGPPLGAFLSLPELGFSAGQSNLPGRDRKAGLLLFVSEGCGHCQELLANDLDAFARDRDGLLVAVIARGGTRWIAETRRRLGNAVSMVDDSSREIARRLLIKGRPYALYVDDRGRVERKGVPRMAELGIELGGVPLP
jgi:hypothetical protein